MRYRRLGRTGLQVSVLGLGGGGRSRLGRSRDASDDDVKRLVRCALELGINLFDTAADYGTEDILGAALDGVARDSIVISTKFGPTTRDGDFRDPTSFGRRSNAASNACGRTTSTCCTCTECARTAMRRSATATSSRCARCGGRA